MDVQVEQCNVIERGVELSILGYPDDNITVLMRRGRIYEYELLDYLPKCGGVYYDFGACIGTHTIYFAKVCKADLVVSFEPNPLSFLMLNENVKRNGLSSVEIYHAAVSDYTGRCVMEGPNGNEGGWTIRRSDRSAGTVPAFRVSSMITAPPSLIKIDAESSTLPILKDLEFVIRMDKPTLYIEFDNVIEGMLTDWGYTLVNGIDSGVQTGIWEFLT